MSVNSCEIGIKDELEFHSVPALSLLVPFAQQLCDVSLGAQTSDRTGPIIGVSASRGRALQGDVQRMVGRAHRVAKVRCAGDQSNI